MTERKVVLTENASKPIGPYSQAIICGEMVFTSGERGIDPQTGKVVEGGIEEETRQALTNIKAVLTEAGTSLERVAKVTVFLADLNEFKAMNGVYATFFTENPPARSCVEAARLPGDVRVEIEAVAAL